jgi:serine/threonine-protein kinase
VAIDGRADLYAVGCVGYWLLAGALVFEADTPTALLVKHAKEEPQPLSTRTELEIPQELEQIVMACLQKDRSDRPASAHDLREELAAIRLDWSEADAESWWQLHLPRPEPPV